MKILFTDAEITAKFSVGERVGIDLLPLYKKPPYRTIEGRVYAIRADFPLMICKEKGEIFELTDLTFRYGVHADMTLFPKMKDAENKFYDLPEAYLSAVQP